MRRLGLLFLLFVAVATVGPWALPDTFGMAVRAEDKEDPKAPQFIRDLRAGRITEVEVIAQLTGRTGAALEGCQLTRIISLGEDRAQFQYHLRTLGEKGEQMGKQIKVLEDAIKENCDPLYFWSQVLSHSRQCSLDVARARLEQLKALAENYRRQARQARAVGEFAGGDPRRLKTLAQSAEVNYEGAEITYLKARDDCAKKAAEPGVADNSKAIAVQPATKPPAPPAEAADHGGTGKWGQLVGRWTSPKFGGVIETRIASDGTLEGRIVSTNPVMERNGYTTGMVVLRGWSPEAATLTWTMAARRGEYFTAVQPDRKPGEMFGDPKWTKDGVIFLETKAPDRLQIPATLEGRISNYDPWMRMSGE